MALTIAGRQIVLAGKLPVFNFGSAKMPATASTIDRRSLENAPASFDRHLAEGLVRASRYFERRAAIGRLREFDDRELRDIGLARTQIEAAVHGLLAAPDLTHR